MGWQRDDVEMLGCVTAEGILRLFKTYVGHLSLKTNSKGFGVLPTTAAALSAKEGSKVFVRCLSRLG